MLGAIIGDIVGSRFQFQDHKGKEFAFFAESCYPTDDSFMTLAIAKTFLFNKDFTDLDKLKDDEIKFMRDIAKDHKNAGWGKSFYDFLFVNSIPYYSCGNGAGMRVSPVGWVANSEEEVKALSKAVTEISHNHPEGIKGAEAIAMAVYLARTGKAMEEIKARMIKDYYPELKKMTLAELQREYGLDEFGKWITCQGSIPQALTAFFESSGFEDAVRNAISIGGDSDTIGCMTGAIAEAYYGIEPKMMFKALEYLPQELQSVYYAFRNKYISKEN